ncbi:GH25 family lysozyme, partial [Levilactobacillus zymae]|uniref:GH25 family lysozyme n=1 Tax=Levilactobacillus zymae TaxID=267363 RepID=UPI0028B7BA6F
MTNKIVDLSSYQSDSLAYMKRLKKWGAKGIIVKLTEGTGYLNPKAGNQIANGFKVFDTVGVYHFFHGRGTAEAKYFLSWVKKMGLDKSTVLAIDVEAPDLPRKTTSQVNVFLRYLISHGYKNVVTYGSGSWFNAGRINRSQLVNKTIWVAAYGVSQPG